MMLYLVDSIIDIIVDILIDVAIDNYRPITTIDGEKKGACIIIENGVRSFNVI